MFVATTYYDRAGFWSGRFWRFDERVEEADTAAEMERYVKQMPLPYGVSTLNQKPSVCQYADRLYVVGGHTSNLVVDEHERVSVQGIMAPSSPPTVGGAPGTGTLAFLSFWDELTDEYSPLSDYTEIGDAVPRAWTGLPTHTPDEYMYTAGYVNIQSGTAIYSSDASGNISATCKLPFMRPGDKVYDSTTDKVVALLRYPSGDEVFSGYVYTTDVIVPYGRPKQRASHVVLWLSVAGALPRVVTKVRLGTTAVTESVNYTELGEAHFGEFWRFPRCTMNTIYHDRQLMAGDPRALDTVYLSAIGYPERYEGFQFTTRNGEAVTALVGTRDYCLVMTAASTYVLQGYTEDDMTLNLVDNGIGAVGHLTNTVVNGYPYVTSRAGINMFNGAWHPVMADSSGTMSDHMSANTRSTGRDSTYNNASFYQKGWMINNPVEKTIQLFLGKGVSTGPLGLRAWWFHPRHQMLPDPDQRGNYSWVLGYDTVQPEAGGTYDQANLSMDALEVGNLTFIRYTASEFLVTDDGGAAAVWFGDTVGGLHREDINEPLNGASAILTPAWTFNSEGGFEREGKTLIKFWSFVDSARSAWKVMAVAGDEWAGVSAVVYYAFAYEETGRFEPDREAAGRLWPYKLIQGMTTGADVQYLDNVAATGDIEITTTGVYSFHVPKSVHEHPIPDSVSGRTISFLYVFTNPLGVVWRGVGGYFGPGPATRTRLGQVTVE